MNLSLVVLAAGASRRFGAANKLLQPFLGKATACDWGLLPAAKVMAVCFSPVISPFSAPIPSFG